MYHLKIQGTSTKLVKVKASFKLPPVKFLTPKPSSVAVKKKKPTAAKSKPEPKLGPARPLLKVRTPELEAAKSLLRQASPSERLLLNPKLLRLRPSILLLH